MFPDIIVWPDAAALYLIQLKPTNISAGGADTFTFSFSAPSAFLFSLYFFFALPIFPSLLPAYISCRAKLRVAARIYFLVRQEGGREDIPACLITLYPTNASAHALAFLLQQFPFSLRKGIFGETQLLFNWEI